jgi:hypothetical protein
LASELQKDELSDALFFRKLKTKEVSDGVSSPYPRSSSGQTRGFPGLLDNKPASSSTYNAPASRGAGRSASIRVLATLHAFREIESIEGLQAKILDMFSGRGLHQAQKKVFDKVFEGQLNKKERTFFAELAPDTYVITSVVLNHKVSLLFQLMLSGCLVFRFFAGIRSRDCPFRFRRSQPAGKGPPIAHREPRR